MDSDTLPYKGQGGIMPVASHTPPRPHPNAISQAYSPAGSHQASPLRPAHEQILNPSHSDGQRLLNQVERDDMLNPSANVNSGLTIMASPNFRSEEGSQFGSVTPTRGQIRGSMLSPRQAGPEHQPSYTVPAPRPPEFPRQIIPSSGITRPSSIRLKGHGVIV